MAGKRQTGILRAFDDGDIVNVGAGDGGVIDLLNFHRIINVIHRAVATYRLLKTLPVGVVGKVNGAAAGGDLCRLVQCIVAYRLASSAGKITVIIVTKASAATAHQGRA